jgi:pyruvate,water dikinase
MSETAGPDQAESGGLLARLRRWCARLRRRAGLPLSEEEAAELGATFRSRYLALKLLLNANNKALAQMAEMEQALHQEQTFGLSFIHSRCTAVHVSVYQMVRHLDELAPGKYQVLFKRLQEIQRRVQDRLAASSRPRDAPMVLPLTAIDSSSADLVGAKMANLGEVANVVGLAAPDGFVITAAGYQALMQQGDLRAEVARLIQTSTLERTDELYGLSSRIQQLIIAAEIPEELRLAIEAASRQMVSTHGDGTTFALRSSALGEDTADASFAGQYRSQLNVRPEHLLDTYREVVASKYTPQAMSYRLTRGLRDDDVDMCVGCLVMVDARAGGVVYSANPCDASDMSLQVSSTWGLPKAVVDGRFVHDQFVVDRGPPPSVAERVIVAKTTTLACDAVEGVCRNTIEEERSRAASLDDHELLTLAAATIRLESHFSVPQDVEYAVADDGRLVILQARPLRQVDIPTVQEEVPAGEVLISGGVNASPGVACGPAMWVRRDSDALRFQAGAVLVLAEPLPRWAALIGRAAAVMAESGGIAGHLATVARELAVPALLGLGELSGIVPDEDEVTVDADQGVVYRGRVDELLQLRRRAPRPMAGSPVHKLLADLLVHIAPLHLLDPDAPSFRADACQTLHDITRFCHEQSVREIFSFGHAHRFPKRSAKQLHYQVPMQWWVLDLDDGFSTEVEGKYVTIDSICCIPMLAIWEGIMAIPWDGPPAVSGRGLISVLFEATANPALATPFRRPFANRNYFMISSSFMNLQSRFGFHLCQVEALVSERREENYVSFSFKGGAASLDRRMARVVFLGELLEEHGFQVSLNEDHAVARLSGLEAETMKRRLHLVGYLLMHTRQLDMIMGDPATVACYRDKLRADLQQLARGDGE